MKFVEKWKNPYQTNQNRITFFLFFHKKLIQNIFPKPNRNTLKPYPPIASTIRARYYISIKFDLLLHILLAILTPFQEHQLFQNLKLQLFHCLESFQKTRF